MTSYTYASPSLIEKVTFRTSDNGSARAYLHVKKDASADECRQVAECLGEQGLYTIPSQEGGKPALEVRGYLREKSLLDLIHEKSWASGEAHAEKAPEPKSFVDRLSARTLQGTSVSFLAADAFYATYGYKEGRPEDMAAGIAYGVGSATMGLIGTNAQAASEIKSQTRKLLKYAKEHDLDLSHNLTIPCVTENNKRDMFHKIVDTLQSYPTEIGNSFTALAGALIAYSSYKYKLKPGAMQHANSKTAGYMDVGLGISTVTSGMVGAWIKEKKPDPDQPRKEGMAGMWEWVQERPLSIAAAGYMLSTACHTVSTFKEYTEAKKMGNLKTLNAVPYRAGFIACTLVGEIFLALSSKGHGEGVKSDISTEDSVIAIAAELIAQQKPELQQELIGHISGFLGRPDVLAMRNEDIRANLAGKLETIRHNPWAEACKGLPAPKATAHPAWQAGVVASSVAATPALGA